MKKRSFLSRFFHVLGKALKELDERQTATRFACRGCQDKVPKDQQLDVYLCPFNNVRCAVCGVALEVKQNIPPGGGMLTLSVNGVAFNGRLRDEF